MSSKISFVTGCLMLLQISVKENSYMKRNMSLC